VRSFPHSETLEIRGEHENQFALPNHVDQDARLNQKVVRIEGDRYVSWKSPKDEAIVFIEQSNRGPCKMIPATHHNVRMLSRDRAEIKKSFDQWAG
jgi:hypothetical protein